MKEGDILWTPDAGRIAAANVTRYMEWLARERGRRFADYAELLQWSNTDLDGFWQSLWDYFRIESSAPHTAALARRAMPGAVWFPGARLNYAQHVLRRESEGGTALVYVSESAPPASLSRVELAAQVRILATQLRRLGVQPGDRVVAWMPNIPQTAVAMLATASVGAIWACCSPDFGEQGVLDRFAQLAPTVLFGVDGYRYGGRDIDRRAELRRILAGLPSLRHVVVVPNLAQAAGTAAAAAAAPGAGAGAGIDGALAWPVLLAQPPVAREQFQYEQVPFDHPLWTLFSSGTTGLPKPIVHGHGGILLEILKNATFHFDLHPDDRLLFFTTSGWMLWNFVIGSMLAGAVPVLYDGSPAYPERDALWKVADEVGAALLGSSPTYVDQLSKAGIVPRERYRLEKLRSISLAGSPATPECMAWFYRSVKADLWVANGSGGTDCCTGFVGGVPTLPVRAGEIQAPSLGVSIKSYNERGESVIDEVGEMVLTEPLPSMPLRFWNDPGDQRYRESYFEEFPGVWRHGDFFRINARGGSYVLGRSDATLNRYGVRIGTAEIYRALAQLDEVEDALIVNLDLPDGGFFMPLFVKLAPGLQLAPAIEDKIRAKLRTEYTARHVPDKVYQVPLIPTTITGKRMEVPVRRILLGMPVEKAANRSAMADPRALDFFIDYAARQRDYSLARG